MRGEEGGMQKGEVLGSWDGLVRDYGWRVVVNTEWRCQLSIVSIDGA